MKKITPNQLVEIVASKLDLEFTTDNFFDFWNFIDEIYPAFSHDYESMSEQICYTYNGTGSTLDLTLPTQVLKDNFEEIDAKLDFSSKDADYFDNDHPDYLNPFDSVDGIVGTMTSINYGNFHLSTAETVEFLQQLSKKHSCKCKLRVLLDEPRDNFVFEWEIDNGELTSNVYVNIEEDEEGMLGLFEQIYCLYEGLCDCTFADFERLGGEIRYVEK